MQTGKTYSDVNESVREIYGDPAPRPNKFLQRHRNIETPLKRHPAICAEAQTLHKVVDSQSGPNLSTALLTRILLDHAQLMLRQAMCIDINILFGHNFCSYNTHLILIIAISSSKQ